MLWLSAALAGSADPEVVSSRLAEVVPLLPMRMATATPSIPAKAWSRAASGETVTGLTDVEGYAARIGWGVAVLDVGIERLWNGLNDELHHQEILGLGHVEVVKGQPCEDGRHVMMLMPLPIISDRWWVADTRYNHALAEASGGLVRELVWSGVDPEEVQLSDTARGLVEGAVAITFNTGAWLLVALEEQTLVEYHTWSDPGGELPAGPATTIANASMAGTILTMERYARESESHCRL